MTCFEIGLNASQANSVQLLLLALEEAEEVIASIPGVEGVQAEDDSAMSMDSSAERWEIEEGERPEIEKWYMMRTASALRRYTFAIDLRIRALQALKEISDLNDKELHLHDTEVMDHCLSTAFNELSDSAKAILNILIPGDPGEMNGNYLLPIRYF